MTIDPKTLPDGTVMRVREARGDTCLRRTPLDPQYVDRCAPKVVQVFVPVPDGMTVEDAQQALTEHVAWVPLPDGPTSKHIGKRLRVQWSGGTHSLDSEVRHVENGKVEFWGVPSNAESGGWTKHSGDWFIHPDDVPTDPDAELIADMAKAVLDNFHGPDDNHPTWHLNPVTVARAALAVVREHEATR